MTQASGNPRDSAGSSSDGTCGCLPTGLQRRFSLFAKITPPAAPPSRAGLRQGTQFDLPEPMHPIPKDLGGGRKMTEREFERVFQIPGNGQGGDEPPIPFSCHIDEQRRLTVAQVIASIEEFDKQRLRQAASIRQLNYPRLAPFDYPNPTPGLLNWRLPIGDHGHGQTITIAQQLVYIGNVSFLTRRQRTVDIMNHLLETDPDLAWGKQRFANGKAPDVTISLACYKARYDIVAAMTSHPTAEYYLPTYAPMLQRPCPKLCLVALINELIAYNNGRGNDHRRSDRDRCVKVLTELHQRRHGFEQRVLERVMLEQVGSFGAEMSKKFISYCTESGRSDRPAVWSADQL